MAYIYKITNNINNKIYVGKTLRTIEERFSEHAKDYLKHLDRPLYKAFQKYGIENFSIEMIEECLPIDINEKEIYWIEYYGSFKYGYNATIGGDGTHYADYDLIFSLWNEGKLLKQIVEITGYSEKTVRTALNNFHIYKEERKNRGYNSFSKVVAMLDYKTEEIIKVFPSVEKAYEFINKLSSGHIAQVCNGKRKSAYGYKWKYL